MRHIFSLMATSTNKNVVIGVTQNLVWFRKRNRIPENCPSFADCGMLTDYFHHVSRLNRHGEQSLATCHLRECSSQMAVKIMQFNASRTFYLVVC